MKRICIFGVVLALLWCAGCGNTAQPANAPTFSAATDAVQTTDETAAEPVSAAASDHFTMEDVMRENAVSTLISAYQNVQMLRYENDKLYSETYYFLHDGKPIWTRRSIDPENGEDFYCFANEVGYFKEGDHLQFSVFLEEEDDSGEDYSIDFDICGQMMDGEVGNIESLDADTWQFEIIDDELPPESEVSCRCTATKQTLTLKTIEWNYGYGSSSRIELRHGSDVKAKDFGMLDGFGKPTHKVTCIAELHDENGKAFKAERTVDAVYNAEPQFVSSNLLNYYLDKNYTKEYVYPGDGVDYTVYATDAMG